MNEEFTRREFLNVAADKTRRPFRMAVRLLVIVVAAWLAIGVLQVLRGITLDGWKLVGCLAVASALLTVARWGAVRAYSRLSERSKALCDAMREVLGTLSLVVIGILAWHRFSTGDIAVGVLVSLCLLAVVVNRAGRVYGNRTDGGERRT